MTNAVKNIAIYVTGSRLAPLAVEAAGKVAQSFGASLLGFHVLEHASSMAMAPIPGAAMNPAMIDDLERQSRDRAATAERQFHSAMSRQGWDGQWLCIDDPKLPVRDAIAHIMHLVDFIVTEQGDVENAAMNWQGRLEDCVVDSGRPVIVHPRGWTGSIGETHALIAWKPTREAARAVHDALPFLTRMPEVTVTAINGREAPGADDEIGKDLADYLAAHGIKAKSLPLHGIDNSEIGNALMSQAAKVGADLLVLGAFSHSRLREGIFGGVTRDVIEKTEIPALLSH